MNKAHNTDIRVYYEDTDSGGVVYYANYLKFAERARTEMLRASGINQRELAGKENIVFVVRHAEMDLLKPARLDDLLTIATTITKISGASLQMEQEIFLTTEKLALIKVKIACLNTNFKPVKLPRSILTQLE